MSKSVIPLVSEDISTFARNLALQLKTKDNPAPSHLSLMNMLARAAGFRNFQHLRAAHTSEACLTQNLPAPLVHHKRVKRALNLFDTAGMLTQWPSRRAVQDLCLWLMWSRLPSREIMQERDVNGIFNQAHSFQDPAIIRRGLISMKLLTRNPDGSNYQRQELAPPPEALALFRHIQARQATSHNIKSR